MTTSKLYCALGLCSLVLVLANCNGAGSPVEQTSLTFRSRPFIGRPGSSSPIAHVVIMIQENRTFNDFFATFPGADGTTTGQVVPNPSCSPPITYKESIPLSKMPLVLPQDLEHEYYGYHTAYDHGRMDAFDTVRFGGPNGIPECTYPYQYTDPTQIQPYWNLAKQYALAEHMFSTQGSGSFTAHQDLIRGGTIVEPGRAMVDLPTCAGTKCRWGCDAPTHPKTLTHLITAHDKYLVKFGPPPCSNRFTSSYPTLRDLLDAKSISWKYYVPPSDTTVGKLMSAFDVIYPVRYGPEWQKNVITPQTHIFYDISHQSLAAVSWLIPDRADSDHPGDPDDTGPEWVADVVNAIGESPYWNSSAIVVVWDDWGGLYDNLAKLGPERYGYGGLGPRVPAIIISPYAKPGYISQTNYEFGSILKYVEQNWNLGSLGTSDQRSKSIIDCFNYSQQPMAFTPIKSRLDERYFLHRKPSYRPIDTDM